MTLRTYGHVIADYRDCEATDAEAEIRAARDAAHGRTTRATARADEHTGIVTASSRLDARAAE